VGIQTAKNPPFLPVRGCGKSTQLRKICAVVKLDHESPKKSDEDKKSLKQGVFGEKLLPKCTAQCSSRINELPSA